MVSLVAAQPWANITRGKHMFGRIVRSGLVAALALGGMLFAGTGPAQAAANAPSAVAGPSAVPVGAGSAILESRRQSLAAANHVALASTDCYIGISIKRDGVNRFVSAELDYTGSVQYLLRARATAIGPWEEFSMCRVSTTWATYIWSDANGRYVSAEQDYAQPNKGLLRARATAVGPWEQFYTNKLPGNCGVRIQSADSLLYVAAEEDFSGNRKEALRARTPSGALGSWENFCWGYWV